PAFAISAAAIYHRLHRAGRTLLGGDDSPAALFCPWPAGDPSRAQPRFAPFACFAMLQRIFPLRSTLMRLTIDATYENGVLKPKQPLVLAEGAEVRVTVTTADENDDPLAAVIGIGEGPADGVDQHDHYIYGTPKR